MSGKAGDRIPDTFYSSYWEGVAEVDCEPVRLAQISRSVENSYIHNFYRSYTELNKVLNHPISHIHVGAGIEAVAFVFEYTSYHVLTDWFPCP